MEYASCDWWIFIYVQFIAIACLFVLWSVQKTDDIPVGVENSYLTNKYINECD